MGVRAQNLFAQKNIQTVLGATGLVDDVAKSFASGGLTGGKSLVTTDMGSRHIPGAKITIIINRRENVGYTRRVQRDMNEVSHDYISSQWKGGNR